MKKSSYIAIEGPIGVGKTSLARILAQELNARLVSEEVDENPFIRDFYRNPKRYALHTQLTFLLLRHRQQCALMQSDIFHDVVVADYIFEKDFIFAGLTLDDRELALYKRVAETLSSQVSVPDLLIYLQTSTERLMTNIRIRDIPYEQDISESYLRNLCEMYNQFMFQWKKSPLLIINSSKMDFVRDAEQRQRLINFITEMPQGMTYFNPEV